MNLPKKWCIKRTPENYEYVNGFINLIMGWRYLDQYEGFVTNEITPGQGASQKKPEGFEEVFKDDLEKLETLDFLETIIELPTLKPKKNV